MTSSSADKDPRLSDEEIERLVSKLKRGEFLEDYYRRVLFREAREMELVFAAKGSKSEILSSTMAVPLQPLKRFGDVAQGAWTNKLVVGDNLQVLKTLLEMKRRGELKNADGSNGVRLCYIDPPFATKREFRGGGGQRAYRDKIAGAEFVEFLRKRLVFIRELLAEDGTLYVHLDPKKGHYIKVVLDEIFGDSGFRNEIIWWYYNKMQGNINRFPSNHDCIYAYSKRADPLFNTLYEERDNVSRLIQRVWDKEKQRLVNAKGPDGKVLYIERDDRRIDDVWRISMLQPADTTEKVGYPTQKPKALLSLIVEASSKPGDLVLDCFVGSGTTLVVADELDRRWIGVDSGKFAIYMAQRRLFSNKIGRGRKAKVVAPKPFDLCSAGMYDNSLLEGLDFESYKGFCLDLFECHQEQFKIGGITFAGRRKGEPVHLFPFNLAPELQMGVDYLESLHDRLKGKVSGAVFVIVPITHCDPGLFADVFPIGKILFFVLRVPYSAIEAIHGRPFKVLDQPFSQADLNDPVDTFGFDFMQLPEVDVRYVKSGDDLHVVVNSFKRGGLDPDDFGSLEEKGRLDLSMVMVDRDYDGEVFRVSDYFFGDQLEDNGWSFSLPLKGAGTQFFFVFMDTHGNELREPIEIATVKSGAKPRVKQPKVKTARTAEEVEAAEGLEEVAVGG